MLSTLICLNAIHNDGKSVKFYTTESLVNKLLEDNEKGTLNKVFKQIEKIDLLVLDEVRYIPLHKQGAELLFQVISLCYEKKSLIITTKSSIWVMELCIRQSNLNRNRDQSANSSFKFYRI